MLSHKIGNERLEGQRKNLVSVSKGSRNENFSSWSRLGLEISFYRSLGLVSVSKNTNKLVLGLVSVSKI